MSKTGTSAHVTHIEILCHTRLMTVDSSQAVDIDAKPIYQASLRLASMQTVHVLVSPDGSVEVGFRSPDDETCTHVTATGAESGEIASMFSAADRHSYRVVGR